MAWPPIVEPKVGGDNVTGTSLSTNMLYVGAQSEVHPERVPLFSMQVLKAFARFAVEDKSSEFTHEAKEISHKSEHGSLMPKHPTNQ